MSTDETVADRLWCRAVAASVISIAYRVKMLEDELDRTWTPSVVLLCM